MERGRGPVDGLEVGDPSLSARGGSPCWMVNERIVVLQEEVLEEEVR